MMHKYKVGDTCKTTDLQFFYDCSFSWENEDGRSGKSEFIVSKLKKGQVSNQQTKKKDGILNVSAQKMKLLCSQK